MPLSSAVSSKWIIIENPNDPRLPLNSWVTPQVLSTHRIAVKSTITLSIKPPCIFVPEDHCKESDAKANAAMLKTIGQKGDSLWLECFSKRRLWRDPTKMTRFLGWDIRRFHLKGWDHEKLLKEREEFETFFTSRFKVLMAYPESGKKEKVRAIWNELVNKFIDINDPINVNFPEDDADYKTKLDTLIQEYNTRFTFMIDEQWYPRGVHLANSLIKSHKESKTNYILCGEGHAMFHRSKEAGTLQEEALNITVDMLKKGGVAIAIALPKDPAEIQTI